MTYNSTTLEVQVSYDYGTTAIQGGCQQSDGVVGKMTQNDTHYHV